MLPASVGLVPRRSTSTHGRRSAPRECRAGSYTNLSFLKIYACSPQVRDWSWSKVTKFTRVQVLPAGAGLVPAAGTRGDERTGAPLGCRASPSVRPEPIHVSVCSLRVRDWSRLDGAGRREVVVLPAGAGLVPPPASG